MKNKPEIQNLILLLNLYYFIKKHNHLIYNLFIFCLGIRRAINLVRITKDFVRIQGDDDLRKPNASMTVIKKRGHNRIAEGCIGFLQSWAKAS
jgi:hypothetical protein